MIEKRGWFQKPLTAVCILSGVIILAVYIIINAEGNRTDAGEILYRITLRHYGTDAGEMENTVAIPLEDALSAIQGINRIVTRSENGQVRSYVSFRQSRRGFSTREDEYYDLVREAAQRVYESLPSSAQRPEISASGDSRVPFWTAAVYGAGGESLPDRILLERTIKPALNSIEGVGEVEIAGSSLGEIVITLDQEQTAALGLSPSKIASVLGSNDALFTGGALRHNGLEIPLLVDGRYSDLEALGEALIPLESSGGAVKLKTIADIREQEREADTLSRLNGKRTVVILVTAASGADQGILSRKINAEIIKFSTLPLEFHVLEDRGAEEAAAFRSVLKAAMEASVLVAIAIVILGRGKSHGLRNGLICAGTIPLICVIAAAILCMAGFPINRKFLAGLAVGIGGAIDAVILSAEGFGAARTSSEGKTIFKRIWPPLLAAAVTTIAALLPLTGIDSAGEISVIAFALGSVTLVSLALALTLLPPLFLWENNSFTPVVPIIRGEISVPVSGLLVRKGRILLKKIHFWFSRRFAALTCFCMKKSPVFPVLSLVITAAAILSLMAAGADTAGEWAEDSVYVQIEFEGGFIKEEGDRLLSSWALDVKKHPAVREIQTGARTGSGYGMVTFEPDKSDVVEIRNFIRSGTIPGAFIYIPEPSPGDRIWNITVSGDDSAQCRELARVAASLCSSLSHVKEAVLNFKDGGPRLTLVPRRELLAQAEIPFSFPADTVRRGVHGPVAYKRNEERGETDVRIRFASIGSIDGIFRGDDIVDIPLALAGAFDQGSARVGSLMDTVKTSEAAGIQRENRRRVASISIRTGPGDPRFFREKTMDVLKDMELPSGYKIEFDPEAVKQAEALSGKFISFFWAILFCYMIIAAAEESFILPLVILLSIPPSLAVPVLILTIIGTPINAAVACALVAVSGMTVNASVISAGELWRQGLSGTRSVYRSLRARLPALIATSGTTLAGAIPFLFLREGNNALVRILSLVTVLGVGTSFFCSITLVPSWMNLFSGIISGRKFENNVPHSRDSKS